ncbi:MAG: hypothetical protein A2X18_10365 [Bacteroidetes bacterium GWF2_40_14]|nr:MAG: hypothetical protein A2X18_10365 [Bacteroidetes bacterium GWF2_40_14]
MLAILLMIVSFLEFSSSDSMDREVTRLENRIHKRQQILEDFVIKASETSDTLFIDFSDFPEDMIIYRYYNDTLQSWMNQLPIANDDIDKFTFGYRINHLNSKVVTNTPLAYVGVIEQYMSLGSAWYIVRQYKKGNMSIVAALLIQTDYPTENNVLKSEINPHFSLRRQLSIVPVTYDESYVVHGKDGGVLFSVLKNLPTQSGQSGALLRWFAMLLAIIALFSNLQINRGVKEFFFVFGGLVVIRFLAIYQSSQSQSEFELFSPNLYAHFGLFNSLADLLITNILIFLLILALFMVRKSLALIFLRSRIKKRRLLTAMFLLIPVLLIPYIQITLKSVIINSSIVLELYKIDEISIYSILVYISYGLLFLALLFSFQLVRPIQNKRRKYSFLKTKSLFIYISVISLYTLVTVSMNGFKKELDRNRVWTTIMSVERDLNLELQLKEIETTIAKDPFLRLWVNIEGEDVIVSNRLNEAYFGSISQRYDLRITKCKKGELLDRENDSPLVDCEGFFNNELGNYGIPLVDEYSRFFFLNNYNGRVSYLGVFTYPGFGSGDIRLYIELDSKFMKETIGYPAALLNHVQIDNFNIPLSYSYGKYLNNRLVTYNGKYNYPILATPDTLIGYYATRKDGFIHFTNKISPENMMVISRPERNIFPYFVTFSYIYLFFSLLIFGILRFRSGRLFYQLPRNSFRWKITTLLLASLVVALVSMGAGSIWFSINYFNESNRSQMEDKMNSVQSTLSSNIRFVQRYNDTRFNKTELLKIMNRLSNNTQIDINVYASDGTLIRTTQQEVFDRFLIGKRMNPEAYKQIVHNNKKQFIHKENIARLTYNSLYAPLYNQDGVLIAIANIPFFSKQSGMRGDASSIIAAIINIYLLLLLAAIFGGMALSNSLSKPLAEISKKMELLDISRKPEHIDYTNKDELGILVAAYNKMVDDLEESTRILAQGEREQAWREMARQIAHEIKNPLTPMRLSIQHLMRLKSQGIEDWPKRFDALAGTLIEQIDILSEAAGEFSSFSRFYSEDLTKVEINNLIREQIVLFNTRDNITISYESETREAWTLARKTQLSRVFVNLLSNAVQAIENQSKSRICVSLKVVDNNYEVSFEDDGPGVADNLTHKLFKPNFTTKTGGTGLGLAICRSIMEQSQGEINYDISEKLGGACFTLKLPVYQNG